jgi:hypothetical protein
MADYLIFRIMAICGMIVFATFITLFIVIVHGIVNKIKTSDLKKKGSVNEYIDLEKVAHAKAHLGV